jgi:galactose-1-phosphate uridylyltransferase
MRDETFQEFLERLETEQVTYRELASQYWEIVNSNKAEKERNVVETEAWTINWDTYHLP